jgi:hypothetical protein
MPDRLLRVLQRLAKQRTGDPQALNFRPPCFLGISPASTLAAAHELPECACAHQLHPLYRVLKCCAVMAGPHALQGPMVGGPAHSHAPDDLPLPHREPGARRSADSVGSAPPQHRPPGSDHQGRASVDSAGSTRFAGVPARRSVTRARRLDDLEFSGDSDSE